MLTWLCAVQVAEMRMREKAKGEELERVRQENNQLRAEGYAKRAENHQLRQVARSHRRFSCSCRIEPRALLLAGQAAH